MSSTLLRRIQARLRSPTCSSDSDYLEKSESKFCTFASSDVKVQNFTPTSLIPPNLMDAIIPARPAQLVLPLATLAPAADAAAAAATFQRYQASRAPETLRRQEADLQLLTTFLSQVGVAPGDLAHDPQAWLPITWGLVEAFVVWQLEQGYAIDSVNVRLATVKTYARLATKAGVLHADAYALIKLVSGFRHAEGRRVDAKRVQTRKGAKKAAPTPITRAQACQLKQLADERDQLLLALLLDHGLRVGEVAALDATCFHLDRGILSLYRSKVDKRQQHRLSPDALAAALAYLPHASAGPLFGGDRAIRARIAAYGQQIGLKLSPHDCRHAWATWATEAGTPLKALQDAGGWSSPAMPLRYAASSSVANDGVRLG